MSSRYAKIKQYIRKALKDPRDTLFKSSNGTVLVWTYHVKGLDTVRVTVGYNGSLTQGWVQPDFVTLPREFDRLRDVAQGTIRRQVAKAMRSDDAEVRYGTRRILVNRIGRVMLSRGHHSFWVDKATFKPQTLAHWLLYGVLTF